MSDRLFPVQQEQLTSDDYYTPRWVFDRMGITFDLDVCAPPGGVEWVPATRYYDQAADGLASLWEGRVWMNPPYSKPAPWVERFVQHGHGVCLIQVSKGRYSDDLWRHADGVYFARDMRFVIDAVGTRSDNYMPLWFVAFGDECVDAIGRLGVVRRIA